MPIFVQEIDSLRIFSSEMGPQLLFQVKQETVDAFHPTRAYTLTAHVLEAYNSYIQMSHESDQLARNLRDRAGNFNMLLLNCLRAAEQEPDPRFAEILYEAVRYFKLLVND